MELRHLRFFVAVAEELHFGRAAARLGVSQPPLSQTVRALEEELDVALLERTSRRVRLTEAGRLFLAEARRTLDQASHAAEVARRARVGEVGELSIGFTTSAPFVPRVAGALFAFREAFPLVHLNLSEMSRDAQVAALADDRLDIGFARGEAPPLLPGSIVAETFLEEDMIVALRADHPLALRNAPLRVADLAGEPFVLYERTIGAGFNEHVLALCRSAGFQPRVVQEASGLATLIGLVAAGFGITILSRSLGSLHLDHLAHRTLADAHAISRLWILHRRAPSASGRRFTDLVLG